MMKRPHTIVIGAGIGGLTAGALLLKAGHRVTVLEAHVYPGGCAGTFYHKKYRFDAGATLAGGFFPGGPHARLAEILDLEWPIRPADPAWVVHLGSEHQVTQWSDRHMWQAERRSTFPESEAFWRKQEMLADISWQISSRPFPWPPEKPSDLMTIAKAMRPSSARALPYLFQPIGRLAKGSSPLFRTFLDGQLLISAQTTADRANALYGSAALDLPRRGVNHVRGGIGALATTLVNWIRANGGEVRYRQQVKRISVRDREPISVHTEKGVSVEGDFVVANVTPWALSKLIDGDATYTVPSVKKTHIPWGAFTLYLGLNKAKLADTAACHHQVILDPTKPLGEGNSVFISLSDRDDASRAPAGMRAATLSTHTAIETWWRLRQGDQEAYETRREEYVERLLAAAELALPGIRQAIDLSLPGTPITFDFYTRRPLGMVGGFPQTSLLAARGPGTGIANVWMVGDSIFPGQSTAGVTLGAMRVATDVLQAAGSRRVWSLEQRINPSTNTAAT